MNKLIHTYLRHYILASLMLCLFIGLISCTSDVIDSSKDDGVMSFTLQLPTEQGTRYGAGAKIDQIHYIVLSEDGKTVLNSGTQPWNPGSTEVQVPIILIPDHTYQLVFFADSKAAESAGYTFNSENALLSIDYSKVDINNDIYDAFYKKIPDVSTNYDTSITISLSRPFAQINIGTDDFNSRIIKDYGLENFSTTFDVGTKNLASGISFISTDTQPISYTPATTGISKVVTNLGDTPNITDKFPVDGYKYLQMIYLLVNPGESSDSRALLDAFFTASINNGASTVQHLDLSSLPAKPKYRTNVYGSLLSSKKGFNVQLTPAFKNDEDVVIDDDPNGGGETSETINIADASDFTDFLQRIKDDENGLAGYTVKLNNDIDLQGVDITAVGAPSYCVGNTLTADSKPFRGVFDGQNYTISNAKVTGSVTSNDKEKTRSIGVFSALAGSGAEVKNVKFANLSIDNSVCKQCGVIGAVLEGAIVSNVEVVSGSISSPNNTGAIVGAILASGSVIECSNNASINEGKVSFSYGANIGGIVGAAHYTTGDGEMNITQCTNTGKIVGGTAVGGIVGLCAGNVTDCTNDAGIFGITNYAGGIVGNQCENGTVKGCTNTVNGELFKTDWNDNQIWGSGGIIGLISYEGSAADYPRKAIITVEKCKNQADIKESQMQSVGGIVGSVYYWANIQDCTNTAKYLYSKNYVAGIVGYYTSPYNSPINNMSSYGTKYTLTLSGNSTSTMVDKRITENSSHSFSLVNVVNDGWGPDVKIALDGNIPNDNTSWW